MSTCVQARGPSRRGPVGVFLGSALPGLPRRARATLAGAPADRPDPQPAPPQIVVVNNTQPPRAPGPSEYKGIPKLPLPEQWIHKRPLDYKYTTIPRPLAQLVNADLGADLSQESRTKKLSATRSPSLEKDDKSPFLISANKSDKDKEVFGFDIKAVEKLNEKVMDDKMTSPNEEASPSSNLRRFRSVSTRLNMCSVNEVPPLEGQQERLEMQNSPIVLECSSAKEKTSAPKFDFSPKILAETMASPRFFTPPETVSPMFFAEPSPKSVYYDTVRSPKFFPETPRDAEVPQSPRALGDHLNRNGVTEKPSSPRFLNKPSPKVHIYNKENYFTFEQSCLDESRASPRPKKYGGRNSIEKERFTPPADKMDVRKYRRHNSCDTNYKTVELNITKCEDNKNEQVIIKSEDVTDCCVKMEALEIEPKLENKTNELVVAPSPSNTAQARRQRLKSISLDSDNAKIIEQNLGLPIAKQLKDQMNEAYKNQDTSTSCDSMERYQKTPTNEKPIFKFEDEQKDKSSEEEPKSPDVKQKKSLRHSSDTQSFIDMPRFSPKEFEITVTSEEGATAPAQTEIKKKGKNLRNLRIDLTKRDSDLEKELLEFEKLYTDAEEKKVKTPTLKVKATSLDSSETVNLSLPQKKTLEVPQNSVSMPNTPKRQLKRILPQKNVKHDFSGAKLGYNSLQSNAEQRRLYMKGQDSGIFLRENHAALMLYQPGTSRMGSRTMGSFDENMTDFENPPEINISGADNRTYQDPNQCLGSNLLNYKQNLSLSSTNLKTLPEGVPSDDFELSAEDEKVVKKLHRRNSNQSLMLSTHSLQSSNCSLNSSGASCHNLATVRTSISNFSLNSDSRQKKLSFDRRDSNTSFNTEVLPTPRVICSSNTSLSGEVSKNCLLQRRGSNNSLTLNILSSNNLSRHSSNTSLNKDAKQGQKKGLLERRSSNTSLTLNINNSNPQLSVNRGLSISNYNLNGSTCNLSRYNSNFSIDNPPAEPRKGILERRSSNTSLTLNIQPQEPRELEVDENLIESNIKDLPHRDKHRKSLSTENLTPKSYKNRTRLRSTEKGVGFGSHDNLWSTSYSSEQDYLQNLTYVCGDQENEIIYAVGRQEDPNFQPGAVRNITTKPLSPQSTSEDFRLYLANMQHLQNASSVLSRQQLRDLNDVFQNGYSKVKCLNSTEGTHCCSGRVEDMAKENPQMAIPDLATSQPCSEYQKTLLRNLHQEFWDMPTNFQEKPIVSGSHPKNRYKTILPNEHSRFMLSSEAAEGYINANFIKVSLLAYKYIKD